MTNIELLLKYILVSIWIYFVFKQFIHQIQYHIHITNNTLIVHSYVLHMYNASKMYILKKNCKREKEIILFIPSFQNPLVLQN